MSDFKDGIKCTLIEEIDEHSRRPHDHDISIFKAQGGPRGNPESRYWEKTS